MRWAPKANRTSNVAPDRRRVRRRIANHPLSKCNQGVWALMRAPSQHVRVRGRTSRLVFAVVLAGSVAAGASAYSAAKGPHGSHARGKVTAHTIHVIEHAVTDTEVPSGGGADVTGNLLTFHNNVFDSSDTKRVGT